MPVRTKICGLTRASDAHAAMDAGAAALGVIVYPPSPRFIPFDDAAPWLSSLPPFVQRTLVTVNEPLDQLVAWARSGAIDALQLHGDESPDFCAELIQRVPLRCIKAIRLANLDSALALARTYPPGLSAFLLDAPGPAYGGTGHTVDWSAARAFVQGISRPVILAGGLCPHNVAEAIRQVRPFAVDVSSGVEQAPGQKDHAALAAFLHAVSTA